MSTPKNAISLLARVVYLAGLLFAFIFLSPKSYAQEKAPAALGWDVSKQGAFVVSLMEDQNDDIWAGTEDKGLWRYTTDPNAKVDPKADPPQKPPRIWVNYGAKELGDDTIYALTQDRKGRIWAGTLRNGVSVWNGQKWQNYGLLDGPLGEHVFALATCPSDGDVWMATNAGLARYSLTKETWSYYTRTEGLPSDQIQALAFDSTGTLYAGTQCDGLVIAHGGDYTDWKTINGPDKMPLSATGKGLPSSQINDVLVADNDTIYVATPCGLARSSDNGDNWTFVRGEDWQDKVKGLRTHPQPQIQQGALNYEPLREDYVTNLGEDEKGLLYIGYRTRGYEIRRPLTDRVPFRSQKEPSDTFPYVSIVLPLREGPILLANYGTGLTLAQEPPAFVPTESEKTEMGFRRNWKSFTPPHGPVALPVVAPAPSQEELKSLLQKARLQQWDSTKWLKPGEGYYEGEDWRTQGDWIGRYGSRYAMLCASGAPLDQYIVNDPSYIVSGFMGPGFAPNSLRHWIHWKKTDNPRVLYNPMLGYSREAEWDDNGETMSMSLDGPDVWAKVKVPVGTHRLSIYEFNKDGHDGSNRIRDYLVELKQGDAQNVEQAEALPTQAKARVRDFWGGVYKHFVVQGPSTFWLKVGRNNSFNTILCGVFVDKLAGAPTKFEKRRTNWLGKVRYEVDQQAPLTTPAPIPAGKVLWPRFAGFPSLGVKQVDGQDVYVVIGIGQMHRGGTEKYVALPEPKNPDGSDSQFYNKANAHELRHVEQMTTENTPIHGISTRWDTQAAYLQIKDFTANSSQNLLIQINDKLNEINKEDLKYAKAQLPSMEIDAHNLSDPMSPVYFYQMSTEEKADVILTQP